jgi:hypothetical protein
MVPIAVEKIANIGKAEFLVELSIPAARDVEIKTIPCLFEHVDVQAAATSPDILGHCSQGREIGSEHFGPSFAVVRRELPNRRFYKLARDGVPELLATGGDERDQNAPFDLAPLQMADRHFASADAVHRTARKHVRPVISRVSRWEAVLMLTAVALAGSKPSHGGSLDQYISSRRTSESDSGQRLAAIHAISKLVIIPPRRVQSMSSPAASVYVRGALFGLAAVSIWSGWIVA